MRQGDLWKEEKLRMENRYWDIGVNLFSREFHDPEKVIRDAAASGVSCILTGSDPQEDRLVDEFTRSHGGVYGTAGIHPHNADSASEADYRLIRRILRDNPRILAVGECGLDYDRMFSTRENQRKALLAQIAIAEEAGMPMFLHERKAFDDMAEIFSGHPGLCRRSVIHCFTGTRDEARRYLEMGFYLGVTGWICDDRRAQDLREAVREIPEDRILLETDAPYLTPRNVPGLGRVNVPGNICHVASALAGYMGIPEERLIRMARENTERLFRLDRMAGSREGEEKC
jgi:TatD DNase family protein